MRILFAMMECDYDSSLGFLLIRNLVEKQSNGVRKVREFGGLIHEIRFTIENDYGDVSVSLAEEIA